MSPTPSPTDPGVRRGLNWKTRRRLAVLVLVVGLPVYVVAAVTVVGWFDRPPLWQELLVYVGLGLLWALPLKRLFLGVGQANSDAPKHDPSRGE